MSGNENVTDKTMENKPMILIVDDEEIYLRLSRMMLDKLGFGSLIAKNGVEAINQYMKYRDSIVLILMDIQMPEMGGIEAFRRLKDLDNKVKVVFSTGHLNEANKKKITPMGPFGYIIKPPSLEEFSFYLGKLSSI